MAITYMRFSDEFNNLIDYLNNAKDYIETFILWDSEDEWFEWLETQLTLFQLTPGEIGMIWEISDEIIKNKVYHDDYIARDTVQMANTMLRL